MLFSSIETEDGDYMFCFDNTFSTVSEKLIFFELILDNMETDEEPDDWKEYVHGTDMLDMKLEDIMVRQQLVWYIPKTIELYLILFSFCFFSQCIIDFVCLYAVGLFVTATYAQVDTGGAQWPCQQNSMQSTTYRKSH